METKIPQSLPIEFLNNKKNSLKKFLNKLIEFKFPKTQCDAYGNDIILYISKKSI